jgi:hypothetical protein
MRCVRVYEILMDKLTWQLDRFLVCLKGHEHILSQKF